jgi:hypothetical protein
MPSFLPFPVHYWPAESPSTLYIFTPNTTHDATDFDTQCQFEGKQTAKSSGQKLPLMTAR